MTEETLTPEESTFTNLVVSIQHLHQELSTQAKQAVNISLSLRNWMIGAYIFEFELKGADRANYGDKLLSELAEGLASLKVSNCSRRQLYRYLRFYRLFPEIQGTLSPQLNALLPPGKPELEIVGTVSPQLENRARELIHLLSYSHLELIVDLDDELQRVFYQEECIRGGWSVRELKRQIVSLYYERTVLSRNRKKQTEQTRLVAEKDVPGLEIRDPYIFEFLGLKPKEVMGESDLENALLDRLQEFLLEMGYGFCFEARKKRILIGERHFFVDLVFYHRILKCHVLIELKLDEFRHRHSGQLNTYLNWYRQNEMTMGDNPPVGILMCTKKNQPLVEFALAGMDNKLFVSRYQLELPGKEKIREFLKEQLIIERGNLVKT